MKTFIYESFEISRFIWSNVIGGLLILFGEIGKFICNNIIKLGESIVDKAN